MYDIGSNIPLLMITQAFLNQGWSKMIIAQLLFYCEGV